ncbi:3-keto-disaccharide hydrolase [Glaciecola sp. 1036]|uniref:3-keto-disaccharide hydrolase n=1 Tax=Alteromonadaceae TaxID=72275 RepID=UPI003D020267
MKKKLFVVPIALLGILSCASDISPQDPQLNQWTLIFNGKNLDGWQAKFVNEEFGVNYKNTFKVKDNKLIASYENWDKFDGRFGHIFYKTPHSHYRLRLEYRFFGEQAEGAPAWAYRNNGIMAHSQDPSTIAFGESFPASLEMQLLAAESRNEGEIRTTGNMCSGGTYVFINGKREDTHCINSTSKHYPGDQWVTAEIEVLGNERVRHFINGEQVFEFTNPHLDNGEPLSQGYISVQAESHGTEFRNIELKILPGDISLQ